METSSSHAGRTSSAKVAPPLEALPGASRRSANVDRYTPDELETGTGTVLVSHSLDILIDPMAAIEGKGETFLECVMRIVHSWNRRAGLYGFKGQRIAIALPSMEACPSGRKSSIGPVIRLFGAKTCLQSLLGTERLTDAMLQGLMISGPVQDVASRYEGNRSCAFIRNRLMEKTGYGALTRRARRLDRMSRDRTLRVLKTNRQMVDQRRDLRARLADNHLAQPVHIGGGRVIHIERIEGTGMNIGESVHVGTYGLSGSREPAFLPVW